VRRREHSGGEPMLPVAFQFIIAMVAHALNGRMARRVEYLHKEVRVLREAVVATNTFDGELRACGGSQVSAKPSTILR
jgi:hypothetical protein